MGLAGVKKVTRIGADPRNTKWSNNENGVGHKLLMAQGWTPGSGLGDSMEGRTVNIKTSYKDDNSGIGCTPQHSQEWSGLNAFNDIFTRINNMAPGEAAEAQDKGLRNQDRVVFMDTKGERIGLDARFVLGGTYTSDLSRIKELTKTISRKEEKAMRKAEKQTRRAVRAEKKAIKAAKKALKTKKAEEVSAPRPIHGRFASRAKYQRAKLGSRMDAAQLAEILGVKA